MTVKEKFSNITLHNFGTFMADTTCSLSNAADNRFGALSRARPSERMAAAEIPAWKFYRPVDNKAFHPRTAKPESCQGN
jgi:hypothetical protein